MPQLSAKRRDALFLKSGSLGSLKLDRVFISKSILVVFSNKFFLHKCWVEAMLCLNYLSLEVRYMEEFT